VSHAGPPIFWTRLIAVIFMTTGPLLHADAPPVASAGYQMVPIKSADGKTTYIQVKNQKNPYSKLPSSDQKIFSRTSSFSNKQFAPDAPLYSKNDTNLEDGGQSNFITKAYAGDASAPTAPNLNAKASFPTTGAYSRNATGFDKNYPTSNADAGQSRTAMLASAASTEQGRTAMLGAHTISTSASPLAGKTFQGPEADAVHHHLTKTDDGRIFISDLPNRALTIDEVRNLINHGFKPNTDVKPEEPSKPLNDPTYKPDPLRDTPAPASDDDKNDPVPAPGTMAAPPSPENSEPLPQP